MKATDRAFHIKREGGTGHPTTDRSRPLVSSKQELGQGKKKREKEQDRQNKQTNQKIFAVKICHLSNMFDIADIYICSENMPDQSR